MFGKKITPRASNPQRASKPPFRGHLICPGTPLIPAGSSPIASLCWAGGRAYSVQFGLGMYFPRSSIRTPPARPADRGACLPWARFLLGALRREEVEKAREPGRARVARRATLARELAHLAIGTRRLDEPSKTTERGERGRSVRVCGGG